MAENSHIAWTDHTHNHWLGCAKISPGCKHCYAEAVVTTRLQLPVWGVHAERKLTAESNRKKPFAWNRKAAKLGTRFRVFCSSLADVFEDRPDLAPWRADLFRMIEATPNLDWLLLTKRPDRMLDLAKQAGWTSAWPNNVWAGCTVEDQEHAEQRIPHLIGVPARIRFLSCEPLLESLNVRRFLGTGDGSIHWVITGGESGPKARAFDLGWAVSLRQQCQEKDAAFFMKQTGSRPELSRLCPSGGEPEVERWRPKQRAGTEPSEWPEELQVQQIPSR